MRNPLMSAIALLLMLPGTPRAEGGQPVSRERGERCSPAHPVVQAQADPSASLRFPADAAAPALTWVNTPDPKGALIVGAVYDAPYGFRIRVVDRLTHSGAEFHTVYVEQSSGDPAPGAVFCLPPAKASRMRSVPPLNPLQQ